MEEDVVVEVDLLVLSLRMFVTNRKHHRERIVVRRRQEQFVVLSQLLLEHLLQLLQVSALRVRVIAHHHTASERDRLQKAVMTHLARDVQIGVHSLRLIS